MLKKVRSCVCSAERYHIPQALEIPYCLHGLTRAEILALRPLTLHTGNYKVHQHGYRQKDGFCRVSWSEQSVLEKISTLNSGSYLKCMLAYRYLTTSNKSRYNHFIRLREEHIARGKQLNVYDYRDNDGIECALWPHLYPFHEWCETKLSGNTSRQSAKVSFTMKIQSEVLDYYHLTMNCCSLYMIGGFSRQSPGQYHQLGTIKCVLQHHFQLKPSHWSIGNGIIDT